MKNVKKSTLNKKEISKVGMSKIMGGTESNGGHESGGAEHTDKWDE